MYSAKRRLRLFRDPAFTGGGDKLAAALTTSISAYNSASSGSWVKITSAEYAALQTSVSGTTIAGTTPTTYSAIGTSTNFTTGNLIFTNVVSAATPAVPANSYVYAIAFYFNGVNSGISVYANNSTSSYTNFSKLGSTLPTTTAGNNYYILKGVTDVTATTAGNLALWSTDNVKHGFAAFIGAGGVRYTSTATPTTSTNLSSSYTNSAAFSIQGLTTTSKQW